VKRLWHLSVLVACPCLPSSYHAIIIIRILPERRSRCLTRRASESIFVRHDHPDIEIPDDARSMSFPRFTTSLCLLGQGAGVSRGSQSGLRLFGGAASHFHIRRPPVFISAGPSFQPIAQRPPTPPFYNSFCPQSSPTPPSTFPPSPMFFTDGWRMLPPLPPFVPASASFIQETQVPIQKKKKISQYLHVLPVICDGGFSKWLAPMSFSPLQRSTWPH
jgi:hypothetical protein